MQRKPKMGYCFIVFIIFSFGIKAWAYKDYLEFSKALEEEPERAGALIESLNEGKEFKRIFEHTGQLLTILRNFPEHKFILLDKIKENFSSYFTKNYQIEIIAEFFPEEAVNFTILFYLKNPSCLTDDFELVDEYINYAKYWPDESKVKWFKMLLKKSLFEKCITSVEIFTFAVKNIPEELKVEYFNLLFENSRLKRIASNQDDFRNILLLINEIQDPKAMNQLKIRLCVNLLSLQEKIKSDVSKIICILEIFKGDESLVFTVLCDNNRLFKDCFYRSKRIFETLELCEEFEFYLLPFLLNNFEYFLKIFNSTGRMNMLKKKFPENIFATALFYALDSYNSNKNSKESHVFWAISRLWNESFKDTFEFSSSDLYSVLTAIEEDKSYFPKVSDWAGELIMRTTDGNETKYEKRDNLKLLFAHSLEGNNQACADSYYRELCGMNFDYDLLADVKLDCATLLKLADIIKDLISENNVLKAGHGSPMVTEPFCTVAD